MPFIPNSEFDPITRRLPASNPAGAVVNPLLDAMCFVLQPLEQWDDARRGNLDPLLRGSYSPTRSNMRRSFCPGAPPPPTLPEIAPPTYPPSACASSGAVAGRAFVFQGGMWQQVVTFGEVWGCTQNRGFPLEAPRWYPEGMSGQEFLGAMWSRPTGGSFIQGYTPSIPRSNNNFRVQIDEITALPCPGCDVVPIIPSRPVIPQEQTAPPEPPIPEIPINIEIPRLPGLPSLPIPVVYIPITPTLNLNAPVTFAPRVELSPEFTFAPKIELNLGGVTIEGGGYPEPIPDVEVVIENGSNCPDPCEPVDYNLIRDIAIQELDAKFPPARPFQEQTETFAAADSGTIGLPNFARWVRIEIVEPPRNVREQEGNPEAPNVFYNGWFSFGMRDSAGERTPIQYNLMSVPVPDDADFFSYTIIGLGTARITVGFDIAI